MKKVNGLRKKKKKYVRLSYFLYWMLPIQFFLLGIIFILILGHHIRIPPLTEGLVLKTYDYSGRIGCGSDSMSPFLSCNDTTYHNVFNQSEQVEIGEVYVYDVEGTRTIHRAIGCLCDCQENATEIIFKGDNNEYYEMVKKENILSKLVGVDFR